MARKNKTISDTWRWGLYLVIGVLFMAGVVFFLELAGTTRNGGSFLSDP